MGEKKRRILMVKLSDTLDKREHLRIVEKDSWETLIELTADEVRFIDDRAAVSR